MLAIEALAPDSKLRRGQSMYPNRFTAIIDFLFGRRRKLALCQIRKSKQMKCLFVVAALLLSARAAEASVLVAGDVTPSDNQFTAAIESLPSAGNKVDPFADPNPAIAPTVQTLWEGIQDQANNTNIN